MDWSFRCWIPAIPQRTKNGRRFYGQDLSLECWVFLNAPAGADTYKASFIRGDLVVGPRYLIGYELGVTSSVPYVAYQTVGGFRYEVRASSAIPYGRWVHLAGTFDHRNNALSLYVDGLLEQSVQELEESSAKLRIEAGGALTFSERSGQLTPPFAAISGLTKCVFGDVRGRLMRSPVTAGA